MRTKPFFVLALLLFSPLMLPAQQICAHRGFWQCEAAGNAQNSLASLKAAQDNGFWGSEFDVHITADDVVVVNHDPSFRGMGIQTGTYPGLLQRGTLSNGEPISTFEQYMDQGTKSASTVLVLEFKKQRSRERADAMMDRCIGILKEKGLWSPSRVMFISFDYEACKRIAHLVPGFTVQYLDGDKTPEEVHADGINGIDYHYSVFREHPDWVARAHRLGMSVNAWTVDRKDDMQYLIGLGVDCITTNKPLELRALLGQ